MKINNKLLKGLFLLAIILMISFPVGKSIYNKLYVNGNNENNIKRSILKIQDKNTIDISNISIIKTKKIENGLIVIYKNGFSYGLAEFAKKDSGDYKINQDTNGDSEKVNVHLAYTEDLNKQHFIIYGYGNNAGVVKMDLGINDNIVTINIPEEPFIETVNISQYNKGNNYRFTYKYYDSNGKEVEIE